jgi:hypothetical protein
MERCQSYAGTGADKRMRVDEAVKPLRDLAALMLLCWVCIAVGGCVGFVTGATMLAPPVVDRGPLIVCSGGGRQFSYYAADVVAVHIFDNGQHAVTVRDTGGKVQRVESWSDDDLFCDGEGEE